MSTPEGRGFYYAAECASILSEIHGLEVHRNTINWAIKRYRDGDPNGLVSEQSPGANVEEVDLRSFAEFAENFTPRRSSGYRVGGTFTIAEAAEALDMPKLELHRMVYNDEVAYVENGPYRFIRPETVIAVRDKK